jgi:hypothetical protein
MGLRRVSARRLVLRTRWALDILMSCASVVVNRTAIVESKVEDQKAGAGRTEHVGAGGRWGRRVLARKTR